jgi:hypothetical protein
MDTGALFEGLFPKSPSELTKKEELILKFMQVTFESLNSCHAKIYALQKVMVDKGVITPQELATLMDEAKARPKVRIGKEALDAMLKDEDISHILENVDLP